MTWAIISFSAQKSNGHFGMNQDSAESTFTYARTARRKSKKPQNIAERKMKPMPHEINAYQCDYCNRMFRRTVDALNTLEHIFSGMMKRRKLNEFRAKT